MTHLFTCTTTFMLDDSEAERLVAELAPFGGYDAEECLRELKLRGTEGCWPYILQLLRAGVLYERSEEAARLGLEIVADGLVSHAEAGGE